MPWCAYATAAVQMPDESNDHSINARSAEWTLLPDSSSPKLICSSSFTLLECQRFLSYWVTATLELRRSQFLHVLEDVALVFHRHVAGRPDVLLLAQSLSSLIDCRCQLDGRVAVRRRHSHRVVNHLRHVDWPLIYLSISLHVHRIIHNSILGLTTRKAML